MAEPFVGEIRIFAFGTIPSGWIACNGQKLPIRSNQALFALLSTTYGGDGVNDFAVPDLRGRVPLHPGTGINRGTSAGEAAHVLTTGEIPAHNHTMSVNSAGATEKPATDNFLGATGAANSYSSNQPNIQMAQQTIGNAGAGGAHNNMQPYLTFNFCIATTGLFPPRP
ncbi:tail fiber protein [Paenibacillus hunanensis]|uniref:phage tail protein n=1 Tax=Paenibacillus hunanensis TaxID=539262 RepID=UPI00202658C1|nr:tail fiber protein [Paenibacillus hunanensis]MCL9660734.1 tail fiber protein [Paenibacillus hunanensis]